MNEEIERLIASIYVSSQGVFDRYAVYKLCEEVERLDNQLDDITWKAKDVDAEEEDELKRIRLDIDHDDGRAPIVHEDAKYLLDLVYTLIKKNINMWDSNMKTVMECHNLRTERDRLKTELETQRQFSKEMVVELGKVQAENNNYKSMYVYPAIPLTGYQRIPSVWDETISESETTAESNTIYYNRKTQAWHDASSFRPSDFDASYAHPDKRQEAEKRSLWKSDETEQTKATWEKFNISKTDFLPQETQETFISPIVSLDMDKVTEKPQREPEVDLP